MAIIIAINLPLALAKIAFGQFTGAVSIFADGLESLMDIPSESVGLVALIIAARPADANHPYGHRKIETLATFSVAALMFVAAGLIVRNGIVALAEGRGPDISWLSFGVMAVSLVVESFLAWLARSRGRKLRSEFLLADGVQLRNDQIRTLGVMAGLGAASIGLTWADPALGFIIAGFIFYTGVRVVGKGSMVLMDTAAIDPVIIERVALGVPGVRECHAVRTRGRPDEVFADLHVLVDPELSVESGHDIAELVAQKVKEALPAIADVVVHLEPFNEKERAESNPRPV